MRLAMLHLRRHDLHQAPRRAYPQNPRVLDCLRELALIDLRDFADGCRKPAAQSFCSVKRRDACGFLLSPRLLKQQFTDKSTHFGWSGYHENWKTAKWLMWSVMPQASR